MLETGTGAFGAVLFVNREGRSLTLRDPKPSPPGPLGCLTTPPGPVLDENPLAEAPSRFGGRVGTGGIPPPLVPSSLAPKSVLKPAWPRRPDPEIVAYPSLIFPFDARVFKRDVGGCNDERSGIDFLARRAVVEMDKGGLEDGAAGGPVEADRYED